MTWLLDTNIIIYAEFKGGAVRERLDETSRNGRVVTSILVLSELLYGALRSGKPEANLKKVEQTLREIEVIPITEASARRFAEVKTQLAATGRTKADVDLHIAATALELGATLVTNDEALLSDIPGLTVENWLDR